MKPIIFNEAQKVWKKVMQEIPVSIQPDLNAQKKILDLFHIGPYYYYIVEWEKLQLNYISPEVETILGYPTDTMDVPFLLSLVHPDDQPLYLNNEATVVDFMKTLTNDQLVRYKMSYDFRIRTSSGEYKRILQQAIALNVDESGNLLFTLGVHTDISHIKQGNKSVLSFIGLEGEPSYINVVPARIYKPTDELFTKREKEVLSYIIKGFQSQEIADLLYVSKYTIDTHRRNLLLKTNTKNPIELVIKVISEGLI